MLYVSSVDWSNTKETTFVREFEEDELFTTMEISIAVDLASFDSEIEYTMPNTQSRIKLIYHSIEMNWRAHGTEICVMRIEHTHTIQCMIHILQT